MRNYIVCLLTLSALFAGCASSAPPRPVTGYDLPKDTVYPVTDNVFINDAITLHKRYVQKDLTGLFTVAAPATVTTCGLSPDVLRSQFIKNDASTKKLEKQIEKSVLHTQGMDLSITFSNEDPDFQIMASTCPVPGSSGSITVRFNSGIYGKSAVSATKFRAQHIGILSLTQDLQPQSITQFVKGEGATETQYSKIEGIQIPTSMGYWLIDETKSVSITRILNADNVIFTEQTGDKNRMKVTAWIDGKLASITNYKGMHMDGESISYARKMKIPGNNREYSLPGSKSCFKDGLIYKTTGPCVVD